MNVFEALGAWCDEEADREGQILRQLHRLRRDARRRGKHAARRERRRLLALAQAADPGSRKAA